MTAPCHPATIPLSSLSLIYFIPKWHASCPFGMVPFRKGYMIGGLECGSSILLKPEVQKFCSTQSQPASAPNTSEKSYHAIIFERTIFRVVATALFVSPLRRHTVHIHAGYMRSLTSSG